MLLWVCGAGVVAQKLTPWTNSPTPLLAFTDQCGIHHTLMAYRGRGCWSTSGLPNVNRAAQKCRPGRALQNKIRQERFVMLAVNYGESSAKGQEFVHIMPIDFLWSTKISSTHLWTTPSRTATIGTGNNSDLRGMLSRCCYVQACCITSYSSCACYCRFWAMVCGMCAFVFVRPQAWLWKTSFSVSSLPPIRNATLSPDV